MSAAAPEQILAAALQHYNAATSPKPRNQLLGMLALNRQALAQALKLPTASRPYWSQITDAGQLEMGIP